MKSLLLSAVVTAPGMIVPGVFSIIEHKEKITEHLKILLLCYTCGCISGMIYLQYSLVYPGSICWGLTFCDIAALIFIGLLSSAVMMDCLWQEVYDFVWIVAAVCGGISLLFNGQLSSDELLSLGGYFFIQEAIMKYAYGKADCHAFCCCGLYMTVMGLASEYYVLHMMVSWCLLIVSQAFDRNIDCRLRLKKPVAMIPYIVSGLFTVTTFVHIS